MGYICVCGCLGGGSEKAPDSRKEWVGLGREGLERQVPPEQGQQALRGVSEGPAPQGTTDSRGTMNERRGKEAGHAMGGWNIILREKKQLSGRGWI